MTRSVRSFNKMEALANKYHEPAHKLKTLLLNNPPDPNKRPDMLADILGQDGIRMVPHIMIFNAEMKAAGATEEERKLVVDWIFITAAKERFSN